MCSSERNREQSLCIRSHLRGIVERKALKGGSSCPGTTFRQTARKAHAKARNRKARQHVRPDAKFRRAEHRVKFQLKREERLLSDDLIFSMALRGRGSKPDQP